MIEHFNEHQTFWLLIFYFGGMMGGIVIGWKLCRFSDAAKLYHETQVKKQREREAIQKQINAQFQKISKQFEEMS